MGEEWKIIPGFSRYEISNLGNVRIKQNGFILVLVVNKRLGYVQITLTGDDKKKHTVKPHRIVGSLFLQTVNGKDEINHKDGNKLNNAAYNLEWCTGSENKKHAYENNLRENKHKGIHTMNKMNEKMISVFDKRTGETLIFNSQIKASEHFGKSRSWAYDIITKFGGETRNFFITRIDNEFQKESDLKE